MLNDYPDILTVKELCEILYVCRNKGYELLESGEIKARKVGRSWRVSKEEVIKYIRAQ